MLVHETNEEAWMEDEGAQAFKDALSNAKVYLEYGSGKSTEYACTLPHLQSVISVESDKSWSDKLYQSIENKQKLHMAFANIGQVGNYGRPVNDDAFKNYHRYMILPWALADKYLLTPDLILVDGRFRVACFLYSLICAEEGTTILFDDYFKRREQYEIAEHFCPVVKRHGRMAEFKVTKQFNLGEITAQLARYSVIVD